MDILNEYLLVMKVRSASGRRSTFIPAFLQFAVVDGGVTLEEGAQTVTFSARSVPEIPVPVLHARRGSELRILR